MTAWRTSLTLLCVWRAPHKRIAENIHWNLLKEAFKWQKYCECLLKQEAYKQAAFTLKNKAPGAEFHQVFWPRIKNFLVETLSENYLSESKSNTWILIQVILKGDSQNSINTMNQESEQNKEPLFLPFTILLVVQKHSFTTIMLNQSFQVNMHVTPVL